MRSNRHGRNDNRLNKLEDAMPFFETDEERMEELKRLTDWLENCELSNRSFVPAGFRFLSIEARSQIEKALVEKKEEKQEKIPCDFTMVDPRTIFIEMFPFWSSPFEISKDDFKFGDRIANINTSKRKYIPFGEIGTVVGHTLDSVIIRFDEPNVVLTDVHNTCPPYTGAVVDPSSLINLTQQAEFTKKGSQQNYREVPEKQGDEVEQNYRKGHGKKQESEYKKNYGSSSKGQGPKHEEEKKEGKGFTKYGKYKHKERKQNNKNYDWE